MDFDDDEPIGLEDNLGCIIMVIGFIVLFILGCIEKYNP